MFSPRPIVISLVVGSSLQLLGAAQMPKIEILYPPGGAPLDRLCKSDFQRPVNDEALAVAVRLRPEFQVRWDAEGPVYLKAAIDDIGRDFPYREMQATLTVCLPASTSVPLIIDVRPFLPTATMRAPDWEFAEVLFHELLHTYVSPALASSALMQKYKEEPPATRYHLHVMSMEEMTLRKLNMLDRLKTIDHDYRNGPDSNYKRAWEIVQAEGYQRFIQELKSK